MELHGATSRAALPSHRVPRGLKPPTAVTRYTPSTPQGRNVDASISEKNIRRKKAKEKGREWEGGLKRERAHK